MFPATRSDPALTSSANGTTNRLDSFFDQVFGDDGRPARPWTASAPLAMWQDDDAIFVEAEMPGMADGDIEVTVHDGMLHIRSERRPEEGRRYLYNGRTYGRLDRSISLPEAVDADDVVATLADGMLRIALPKRPEAKPKRIAIKSS